METECLNGRTIPVRCTLAALAGSSRNEPAGRLKRNIDRFLILFFFPLRDGSFLFFSFLFSASRFYRVLHVLKRPRRHCSRRLKWADRFQIDRINSLAGRQCYNYENHDGNKDDNSHVTTKFVWPVANCRMGRRATLPTVFALFARFVCFLSSFFELALFFLFFRPALTFSRFVISLVYRN